MKKYKVKTGSSNIDGVHSPVKVLYYEASNRDAFIDFCKSFNLKAEEIKSIPNRAKLGRYKAAPGVFQLG